jgi:fatty-acyl-CoA synthase
MSGRVLVPINFRLHAHEVEYIVEHSGARVLLIDPELDASLPRSAASTASCSGAASDDVLFLRRGGPVLEVAIDEDATGDPQLHERDHRAAQGGELTHRNLWMNATTFGWHAGVSDRDRFLHMVPLFHCNGWGMPFALAAVGAPQVILRKASGPEILRRVEEHGITFTGGAPAVVNAFSTPPRA